MEHVGRGLLAAGLVIAAMGALMWLGVRFGRLPGDLVLQRPGLSVYVPITTMVIASLALTSVFWMLGALRR